MLKKYASFFSRFVLTLGVLSIVPILSSLNQPALAGWNDEGANFFGAWNTSWESPTGTYASPLQLSGSSRFGQVKGYYNNGTVSGTTAPHYDGSGKIDGLTYQGKWQRTGGNSGGSCQYGRFYLFLPNPVVQGTSSGKATVADLNFSGKWNYCDADPQNAANPQLWRGTQALNVSLDGYTLPVPLYSQLTNMWCWAASSEMVVKYLFPSININQGQEANLATGHSDCSNDPTPGACVVGGWQEFAHYGVTFIEKDENQIVGDATDPESSDSSQKVGSVQGTGKEALSWNELKSIINSGQPAMFAWAWRIHPNEDGNRYVNGGHMMVARGWSSVSGENFVYVNDPWLPQEGNEEIMTYDYWVGGLESYDHVHWADFYNFGRGKSATNSIQSRFSGLFANKSLSPLSNKINPLPREVFQTRPVSPIVYQKAVRSLPVLRSLAAIRTNFKALGFRSTSEANTAQIGQPIQEYLVSTSALAAYTIKKQPTQILNQTQTTLYPLVTNREVRSSIRIVRKGEQAITAAFGNANLIKNIDFVLQKNGSNMQQPSQAAVSAVKIPALGLYFVARQVQGSLELAPIFNSPALGLVKGRYENASTVFARLAPFAASFNGKPE